jgi:hypothetical protein
MFTVLKKNCKCEDGPDYCEPFGLEDTERMNKEESSTSYRKYEKRVVAAGLLNHLRKIPADSKNQDSDDKFHGENKVGFWYTLEQFPDGIEESLVSDSFHFPCRVQPVFIRVHCRGEEDPYIIGERDCKVVDEGDE